MLFPLKIHAVFKGNSIFYYKFGLQIPDLWSTLVEHKCYFNNYGLNKSLKETKAEAVHEECQPQVSEKKSFASRQESKTWYVNKKLDRDCCAKAKQ